MDIEPESWEPEDVRPWMADFAEFELAACAEALADARSRIDPWSGRDLGGGEEVSADDLVMAEGARGFTSFAGMVDLCRSGFGRQAAMLNRSLFEGMVVAHWIHANEAEALEVLQKAARFERHLTAGVVDAVGWNHDVDPKALEDARLDDQEVKPFQSQFGRFGERLWTGRSLHSLVGAVEDQWSSPEGRKMLWEFFRIVHRDNNQMLHSSISALRATTVGRGRESRSLRVGASTDHVTQALWAGHWTFANLFNLVIDRFELDGGSDFQSAFERQQFDFVLSAEGTWSSAGRNDPCPCGSGTKYKRCHEEKVQAAGRRRQALGGS